LYTVLLLANYYILLPESSMMSDISDTLIALDLASIGSITDP
jgi:hypothetical protein